MRYKARRYWLFECLYSLGREISRSCFSNSSSLTFFQRFPRAVQASEYSKKGNLHGNVNYSHQLPIVTLYWDIQTFSPSRIVHLICIMRCLALCYSCSGLSLLLLRLFISDKRKVFYNGNERALWYRYTVHGRPRDATKDISTLSPTNLGGGDRGEVQDYL